MKNKKLVTVLSVISIVSILMTGCGSFHEPTEMPDLGDSEKAAKAEIILRAGETNPANHIMSRVWYRFSDIVNEKSNGRIYIEVYPAGQLGDERTQLQTLQMGALDFFRVSTYTAGDFGAEKFNLFSLPYLFTGREHLWKVVNSEIGSDLLKDIDDNVDGMVGLSYLEEGARNFFTTKKAATKPEDLKGMKIRIAESSILMDTIRCFGANPTPISYSELFTSLQTGVVDGADQPLSGYYSNSFNEVSPYMVMDGHTYGLSVMVMSKRTFEKLSKEDQELIREAALEASMYNKEVAQQEDDEIIKKLEEANTPVVQPEDITKWQEMVQPVYDKYGKEYSDLIEEIKAMQ